MVGFKRLFVVGLLSLNLFSNDSLTIGDTFPIAESDFIDEVKRYIKDNKSVIENKLSNWRDKANDKIVNYKVKDSVNLPKCTKDKVWFNDMSWSNTLQNPYYPIGTKVYPLKTLSISYGVYIINPENKEEIDWLKQQDYISLNSRVWINKGSYLKLSKELKNIPIFHYMKNIHERLRLNCTPSYFYQEGDKFKIFEFSMMEK
jgi:hypothetical protein